ncbi:MULTISPECIES: thiamine pyrophosphate-dependent enzyme [Thermodesulfovibrio]|jgi:indolepyruvate ferredoxin oxidoreductase alpha subunit|uniref:thiamine pyrophosphate-dependent enzyme n=1 Tax=Thermodesulfovibrio TaxID=28261 RepID=UPI00260769C9|nr:thiamine pyrophosphate-dependent enzyme [Thermodesulfovibrio sp.]
MKKLYLSGNEAIAYGLVQAGVRFISGYPGTPSSEIVPAAQKITKNVDIRAFIDWAINEKVAYEVALSASLSGIPSAVTMKQVGLNVAMDPFMNSAYVGTNSAMVLVSVDDPGPHSSQTEQDSRLFAMAAKIPVFDPSNVQEAYDFSKKAVELSKKYGIPVMLRSTTRVSHGRADVELKENFINEPLIAQFKTLKDWDKKLWRYAGTPRQRLILHATLNEKIAEIERENELKFFFNGDILIVSSGAVFSYLYELIEEYGLQNKLTLAKADMPYPLKRSCFSGYGRVITVEESMPVIELQLCSEGRRNGVVPKQGELTPEVCEEILERIGLIKRSKTITVPPLKRPSLCPGCAHRIALYAVKKVFGKKSIYAGDIGCYTLALNFGVTDTVLCMGASVSFGFGFKKTFQLAGIEQDVVSVIGDSTFFHTGLQPLVDAVHYRVPFLTVILDNKTVAMTGNQKTLSDEVSSSGEPVTPISIENIVRGIGVNFVQNLDPYDFTSSVKALKEAKKFLKEKNEPAVIVFRHLCINTKEGLSANPKYNLTIDKELCKGCKLCITEFECPAIVFNEEESKADIDQLLCIKCGCCVHVCPTKAIRWI